MQKIIKGLTFGTVVWLIVFVANSIYSLFQMNETGIKTTFSGLRITNVITPHELNTTFTLTLKAVWMYLIFISVWISLFLLFVSLKKRYYKHELG